MITKTKVLNHLFFVVMGIVYTYALTTSILSSTSLFAAPETILFLSCFCILIFYIYFFNKYTIAFFSALIIFVSFFVFFILLTDNFETEWFVAVSDYLYDMYWFIRGYFAHDESYDYTITCGVCFAVALITSLNIKVRFSFLNLAVFGGSVILIPLIMNYSRSEEAATLFVFCFIVFLGKKLNLYAKVKKRSRNEEFSVFLIPVCIAVVFLASLLPSSNTRRTFSSGTSASIAASNGEAFRAINDFFYSAFNAEYFTFQSTGFAGAGGRLGGQVNANGQFVMEVYADERVYLSGSVKDKYTGFSWENTKRESRKISETAKEQYSLAKENENSFTIEGNEIFIFFADRPERKKVTIDIGTARTQSIFLPPYPVNITFKEPVGLLRSESGDILAQRILDNYAAYTIEYEKSHFGKYFITQTGESAMPESFEAYLSIPENLPRRVRDLAEELTRGAASNEGKMETLVDFLHGFSYTLEPENVPRGRDFVDYFLFDGKEGYCTYFASALAVMGRCAGIPTRYIEGYVMPNKKNAVGAYEVTNYQAHAWVEAYINGVWAAFEPTAPFAYAENNAQVPSSLFSPNMTAQESPYNNYMSQMGFMQPNQNLPPAAPPVALTAQEEAQLKIQLAITVILALLLFSFILLIVFLILAFARKIKFRRINKSSNRDAVISYFAHILKATKVYTYPIRKNETVFTYAKRVGRRFAFINETVIMEDLAKIFSKASYGNNEITDEEKNRMKACYEEILEMLLLYRLYKPKFMLYKYVLFKI
ncbi:MAG: transglutaminase-like domain-containing protein [Clostridiales bacterium]|jgi:transglutaminase-like putative cysteine protease|nr:transglutaminase-like domain-containing protein [Clostridiales bacterium]